MLPVARCYLGRHIICFSRYPGLGCVEILVARADHGVSLGVRENPGLGMPFLVLATLQAIPFQSQGLHLCVYQGCIVGL